MDDIMISKIELGHAQLAFVTINRHPQFLVIIFTSAFLEVLNGLDVLPALVAQLIASVRWSGYLHML
jgi:hypothetical protein